MNRSLWISATGMSAQERSTENIANNIANVNTTAYKKSVVRFQDMLYETMRTPGAETDGNKIPAGIQMGTGTRVATVAKIHTQGSLQSTSSELDFAIEGKGFFEVKLPDGSTAYTRDGNFQKTESGTLVTADGYEVISVPAISSGALSINVTPDGTVTSYVKNGAEAAQNVANGRISIVRFPNDAGLRSLGRNIYQETEASGAPISGNPGEQQFGSIAQYYLESSNVDIVTEMVDMISAQRAYELNSKGIKTADDMMKQVANLK